MCKKDDRSSARPSPRTRAAKGQGQHRVEPGIIASSGRDGNDDHGDNALLLPQHRENRTAADTANQPQLPKQITVCREDGGDVLAEAR